MELWRDIPGYEGIYQASNLGNIRTCEGKTTFTERHGVRKWTQRTLKQKISTNKYGRADARVHLWKSGKEKTYLVARLVGMAWCEGFSEELTINHINGITLDNRAENLEWISNAENIRKGYATGLYSNCQKPVSLIDGVKGFRFDSMAEASRFLGWNNGYIDNCLRKHRAIRDRFGNVYSIQFEKEVN